MKVQKKVPRKQLEKFSNIFMQLGLVLTLFVVLISLEHKTEIKKEDLAETTIISCGIIELNDAPKIFKKEVIVKKKTKPVKKRQSQDLSIINKKENDYKKTKETVIDTPLKEEFNIDVLPELPEDEDINKDEEPKTMMNIQNIPIFKGCENLSKAETKKCFDKKIMKHVQRNFDSKLAQEVGLSSGKHRIYTQFIIDKNGEVTDIKVRASNPRLKKEATRVVNKIPKFTPGKQNNKPVKVKYTLPIVFRVN